RPGTGALKTTVTFQRVSRGAMVTLALPDAPPVSAAASGRDVQKAGAVHVRSKAGTAGSVESACSKRVRTSEESTCVVPRVPPVHEVCQAPPPLFAHPPVTGC